MKFLTKLTSGSYGFLRTFWGFLVLGTVGFAGALAAGVRFASIFVPPDWSGDFFGGDLLHIAEALTGGAILVAYGIYQIPCLLGLWRAGNAHAGADRFFARGLVVLLWGWCGLTLLYGVAVLFM